MIKSKLGRYMFANKFVNEIALNVQYFFSDACIKGYMLHHCNFWRGHKILPKYSFGHLCPPYLKKGGLLTSARYDIL